MSTITENVSSGTEKLQTRTREEIESLIKSWEKDPCFDLEDVGGFEAHRAELEAHSIAFRKWQKAVWEASRPRYYVYLVGAPQTAYNNCVDVETNGPLLSFTTDTGVFVRTTIPWWVEKLAPRPTPKREDFFTAVQS